MITAIVEETMRKEHDKLGMFVLVLMSHGMRGDVVLGSDDEPVSIDQIKECLSGDNFPGMSGKPKLIIVQASSGSK